MTDTKDPTQGELLRDEGIARVTENNPGWVSYGLDLLRKLPKGTRLTGESLGDVIDSEIGKGAPNARGALFSHAVKKKLLRKSGKRPKRYHPQSHASDTPEWIVI